MERWDAYDLQGRPLHRTLLRGEPIPQGMYHLVSEVLLQHTDGSWLLMRRDPRKPLYPGFWEASAGGSALAGENAEQAARREVLEETGLVVGALRRVFHTSGDFFLLDYFIGSTDCPKDAVVLQPEETVDYRWVDTETLLRLIEENQVLHANYLAAFTQELNG